jgi:very-short-patch-repair endonuclease
MKDVKNTAAESSGYRRLSQQEIQDLREDMLQASKKMKEYLRKKRLDMAKFQQTNTLPDDAETSQPLQSPEHR